MNVQLARIPRCVIFNVESFLYEHGVNLQKEINRQINVILRVKIGNTGLLMLLK